MTSFSSALLAALAAEAHAPSGLGLPKAIGADPLSAVETQLELGRAVGGDEQPRSDAAWPGLRLRAAGGANACKR